MPRRFRSAGRETWRKTGNYPSGRCKTIATSLSAAFGFVIALMWNTVVQSAFATASIPLGATATAGNWGGWATFVVSAVVITVVMVIFIVLMGRLAGKEAST
ncbi:MAG: DUF5654 family protein [Methanobacteriota archaeon]